MATEEKPTYRKLSGKILDINYDETKGLYVFGMQGKTKQYKVSQFDGTYTPPELSEAMRNAKVGDQVDIEVQIKGRFLNLTKMEKFVDVNEEEESEEEFLERQQKEQEKTLEKHKSPEVPYTDKLIELEAARHDASEITKGLLMCGFFNPKEQTIEDVTKRFRLLVDEILKSGRR